MPHNAEKVLEGTIQCFRKLRVSKDFRHKKGISLFSVETFLYHRAEKFRGWTIQCFRKLRVSKDFRHKQGGITILCWKNFVSVPKKFAGETSCVSESFGYRKILCIRRGFHYFLLKLFFASQCRKISWGNHSLFQKTSGIEIVYTVEGEITILLWKFFVSQCRKCLGGTMQCFRKFRVSKNFMHKKGISLFSDRSLLSQSAEKVRRS